MLIIDKSSAIQTALTLECSTKVRNFLISAILHIYDTKNELPFDTLNHRLRFLTIRDSRSTKIEVLQYIIYLKMESSVAASKM